MHFKETAPFIRMMKDASRECGRYSFHCSYYKQKKGRTNKRGKSSGIANKLKPQVQQEVHTAAKIIMRILNDTMKQPPLFLYETEMVPFEYP
jgi:hypothetical protein